MAASGVRATPQERQNLAPSAAGVPQVSQVARCMPGSAMVPRDGGNSRAKIAA